ADVERAAWCAIWAGLSNAGQSCGAVERLYVHEAVWDRFIATLEPAVRELRSGPDIDFSTDLGSMTTIDQLDVVRRQLADALESGGRELASSVRNGSGLFHQAVLVETTGDSTLLVKEETFGPLLAVRRVGSADEAIRLANDSRYGLTASVFTARSRLARQLCRRLEAGAVTVNDHLMSHGMPETPWGGVKDSGIGRSHSRLGFDEMTQPKVVVEERFRWIRRNMWWQPYSKQVYEGVLGALEARYGKGVVPRVRGLARAVRLFIRRASGR
ncbi:MAG: aldehyde dehydrogenase family protein, partial [Spirochaetota bacterium]